MNGRMGAQLHSFLTSIADEGEWSASSPSPFTPREIALAPNEYGAGCVQEPVWTWCQELNSGH
jgi:hypothetical protein